jgi:methylated-DNA-[protein]-cysteine S-methyltransferase
MKPLPKVLGSLELPKQQRVNPIIHQAIVELGEYFAGKRKIFSVPLSFAGTEFQKNAWKALTKIPYGKKLSYKEQAKRIKNEKAVRAIGTANGHNPICIIVPCHRVVASNGGLGGYSGGLSVKKVLLDLEAKI